MIGGIELGAFQPMERVNIGFKELSSGVKSVSTTSPALIQIGMRLLHGSTLAGARNSNLTNQMSSSRTKSAFLESSQSVVMRISELAVKANSGLLSSSDKKSLQMEADELSGFLTDTMQNASFNGQQIMNDPSFTSVATSLQNIDFQTSAGIDSAAMASSAAIDILAGSQAELGAEQNIIEHRFDANRAEQANLLDAGSRMVGVDMAASFSQFTGDMILSSVGMAVAAQGAQIESSTLRALFM
ncbi:MAG: hypothetical protein HRT88_03940 [Lentisphaeraceae bacterium]|nr:hypothetical protein [Lentisphaeraceae bacterium]